MRLMPSFAAVVLFGMASITAGSQDATIGQRIRPADEEARQLLAIGERDSPTMRALLARLEDSDLIVLVSVRPPPAPTLLKPRNYHGCTRLVGTGGGQRYLAIWLDASWRDARRRAALLAHELHHALEIARDLRVIDQDDMVSLYRRIGYEIGPQRFETDGAMAVEDRVRRELAAAAAASAPTWEPTSPSGSRPR